MKLVKIITAGLLIAGLSAVNNAEAQITTFNVPMNNKEFRGNSTIRLKNELTRAYPGWDFSNARLEQFRVFAKSRQGEGQVELQVDNIPNDRKGIPGRPSSFASSSSSTYNQIRLNVSGNGRGNWQLKLDGRIKVQKFELRARGAVGPDDIPPTDPVTRYVNIGIGNTIKIIPRQQQFNVNQTDVESINIEAQDNLLVITQVEVEYSNGAREVISGLAGQIFQGRSREARVSNGNVRRIWVTGLTAIPFGPDASYYLRVKVTN